MKQPQDTTRGEFNLESLVNIAECIYNDNTFEPLPETMWALAGAYAMLMRVNIPFISEDRAKLRAALYEACAQILYMSSPNSYDGRPKQLGWVNNLLASAKLPPIPHAPQSCSDVDADEGECMCWELPKHLREGGCIAGCRATRCSVCNETQFGSAGGLTCRNGHGGAPPAEGR